MAEIIVCCGDIRIPIALNDNGNLLVHSLKTHFPSANRLTYNDDEDKVHNLALDSDEVILQPAVKEYYVHQSNGMIILYIFSKLLQIHYFISLY